MSGVAIVRTVLTANGPVKALVGARVYVGQAPEPVQGRISTPYVVLNVVGRNDPQLLGGDAGYPQQRVRTECIGDNVGEAYGLGDVVFEALRNVTKQVLAGARDVDILSADTDYTDPADQQSLGRRTLDFYVRWKTGS